MKNETKSWLMLIGLSIVWGSSFILMEKSMHPEKGINSNCLISFVTCCFK